jgi:splicing factor 3B subunit 2
VSVKLEQDDSLDDVEIEYVVQPVDLSKAESLSSLDEATLQQFSDIFKYFQNGKQEEDDEEVSFWPVIVQKEATS